MYSAFLLPENRQKMTLQMLLEQVKYYEFFLIDKLFMGFYFLSVKIRNNASYPYGVLSL